jgi:predicted amidohydrolase
VTTVRIALANVRYPATREESVANVQRAIVRASGEGAKIICFPEAYVPGYRGLGYAPSPPDQPFLERAWAAIGSAAAAASIAVVLGTERVVKDELRISALVIHRDGTIGGFQDKVQLDPSEDETYSPAAERRVFKTGDLTFGVAICHEGWRYPETVRWAVRHGAQVVFHPHFHPAEPGGFRPTTFGDPANSFHETSMRSRAAENTCYVASVNYASDGSQTTSTVMRPDGTLLAHQPYGQEGVLIADLDLSAATGLLAKRLRTT